MSTIDTIYRIAGAHEEAALLHAAHAARVFEILSTPLLAQDVAAQAGWIPWKTEALLNALTALGLVSKLESGQFTVTEVSARFLLESSPEYIGTVVELLRRQWTAWGQIHEIMATENAHPAQQDLTAQSGDLVDVFQKAMEQAYSGSNPRLLELELWKGNSFVVDIGGGHGTHLCALAQRYPQLRGEVWDYAAARAYAEQNFLKYQLEDRLSFISMDFRQVDTTLHSRATVVMLNHCVHHFLSTELEYILLKACSVIERGGALLITEEYLDDSGCIPAWSALFSFGLMVNNQRAVMHPTSTLTGFVEKHFLELQVLSVDDERMIIGRGRRA